MAKKGGLQLFSKMADWVIKNFFFMMFVAFVMTFYIGNSHLATKKVFKIQKLQDEVEVLRREYYSLKSELMFQSKRTEIEKKVQKKYLKPASLKPKVIEVADISE